MLHNPEEKLEALLCSLGVCRSRSLVGFSSVDVEAEVTFFGPNVDP